MMNFLRKHQKTFFVVISIVTLASFTFFGTFTPSSYPTIPDREVARALDGSPITHRQLQAMIGFLSMGSHAWIREDLKSTGILPLLTEKYFPQIEEEFRVKIEHVKHFIPYAHPKIPFLGAVRIWNQYTPQLLHHLKQLQQAEISPKSFATYCDLYLDQVAFPPHLLCQILLHQQESYPSIPQDPRLQDPFRLALFGYRSFEEWFGSCFTEILGQFLWNTAILAEEKGYTVSLEEARASLTEISLDALEVPSLTAFRKIQDKERDAVFAKANRFFHHQIQQMGIKEEEAVIVWRRVMLAYRFLNDVGQSVLIDPLSYQKFLSFADETVTFESYQLPPVLRIDNVDAFLALQCYLDTVTPTSLPWDQIDFSKPFLTVAEVENKAPELIINRYDLEFRKVTKKEVENRFTLKETWEYEAQEEGWRRLKELFPVLTGGTTREERLMVLEKLDPILRLRIDQAARSILFNLHSNKMEEVLELASFEREKVDIPSQGKRAGKFFKEIEDLPRLNAFLQGAPRGEKLPLFTSDQQTFYQIIVWNQEECKEVMTLEEALQGDYLENLVEHAIEKEYLKIREKHPALFQSEKSHWKPFSEVREQVATLIYQKQFSESIDRIFLPWLEKVQREIQTKGEASSFLLKSGDPLVDQWKLVQQLQQIKRSDDTPFPKIELFSEREGQWSSILTLSESGPCFFRILDKKPSTEGMEEKMINGQQLLGNDAKRELVHQLLEKMQNRGER